MNTPLTDPATTRSSDLYPQPISKRVWREKYRFTKEDGTGEASLSDTRLRVARTLAESYTKTGLLSGESPKSVEVEFFRALEDHRFIPGGRILAGAGTKRNVTLFNCFVMGRIPDTMEGIFSALREAALTMKQGGGIGYDFSTLRPEGSVVRGAGSPSSGPLSFMDMWDAMCRTIMSAGARRGAMMGTMRCDHPDILEFIRVKKDPARMRKFNLSVLVTDDFLRAVRENTEIPLTHASPKTPEHETTTTTPRGREYVYERISARKIWDEILDHTYECAEPGVIFIDRINQQNNLKDYETIYATNPCGEQPLPSYGACLLGSVNLSVFVRDPFTDRADFYLPGLDKTITTAVKMLDSVIEASAFPLAKQKDEALAKRRIGLGITGVADAMFKLGLRYGTEDSVVWLNKLMQHIWEKAYETSHRLATVKGRAPVWHGTALKRLVHEHPNLVRLPEKLKQGVIRDGLRNSHLLSIAPTGTISLLAGNISSGIEPFFAEEYKRKILLPDGTTEEETILPLALREYYDHGGQKDDEWYNRYMVTVEDLEPVNHLKILAAAQRWVDSSISKTINCPADITRETFGDVYLTAYELGCKSCATYRPNSITGSVLSTREPVEEELSETSITDRPEVLEGKTYKCRWKGHAVYVTFNHTIRPDEERVPFEVFVRSKRPEHEAWVSALTRMVSAVFRREGDVYFVVNELKNVFDPEGGQFTNRKFVPSLPALLGTILERYLVEIGYIPPPAEWYESEENESEENEREEKEDQPELPMDLDRVCPECRAPAMVRSEGCWVCRSCGHSACG